MDLQVSLELRLKIMHRIISLYEAAKCSVIITERINIPVGSRRAAGSNLLFSGVVSE
jgi:hypothetical protein